VFPDTNTTTHGPPLPYHVHWKEEEEEDDPPRGRGITRKPTAFIPSRQRILSPAGIQRRLAPTGIDLSTPQAHSFVTTDSPPTPAIPTPDATRGQWLEPKPQELTLTTLSELISQESSSDEQSDTDSMTVNTTQCGPRSAYESQRMSVPEEQHFRSHRNTFALLRASKGSVGEQKITAASWRYDAILHLVAPYLNEASWRSVGQTCRTWYGIAMGHTSQIDTPILTLPVELIQEVYKQLSPFEFEAARHVCRAWMLASMKRSLLELMLRRSGCWSSVKILLNGYSSLVVDAPGQVPPTAHREVQFMSLYFSRECLLNGYGDYEKHVLELSLSPDMSAMPGNYFATFDGPSDDCRSERSPFTQVLETDFLALFGAGTQTSRGTLNENGLFKASLCGRFILVAQQCNIYIYQIDHETYLPPSLAGRGTGVLVSSLQPKLPRMLPLTSIVCPRRVLAMSMDTSAGRYAVAALLEDRMGIMWDLLGPRASRSYPSDLRETPVLDIVGRGPAFPLYDSYGSTTQNASKGVTAPIALELGPRSVYRALGKGDDPALSVAICPHRQCVAFGYTLGIELHWVDALTGQDLKRWCPMTTPSDYLYFLPSQPVLDNGRRLRLISSAGSSTAKDKWRGRSSRISSGETSTNSLAWQEGSCQSWYRRSDTAEANQSVHSTRDGLDNYRAIPLSDGHHVLFTCPWSYQLCLGTDAPIGGPTKLMRRVLFQGPECRSPDLYAAGANLDYGVRIVAAYGSHLWFFTVPSDIFRCEWSGLEEPWTPYYSSLGPKFSGLDYKLEVLGVPCNTGDPNTVWPLKISGTRVAIIPDIVEVAVNSTLQDFTIWAFSSDGTARAWQPQRDNEKTLLRREFVGRNGAIFECVEQSHRADADGDVTMEDAPLLEDDDEIPVFATNIELGRGEF
jgi:hypothetical protein